MPIMLVLHPYLNLASMSRGRLLKYASSGRTDLRPSSSQVSVGPRGCRNIVLQRVDRYLGYNGRGANAFRKAVRDPNRTFDIGLCVRWSMKKLGHRQGPCIFHDRSTSG